MNDLAITGSSIGTGLAIGGLVGVATKSVPGAALGAAAGLAVGGLASYTAQHQHGSLDLLEPRQSVPLLIGTGAGIGLASMYTSYSQLSRTQNGAILGAAAIVGALGALALANAPWES